MNYTRLYTDEHGESHFADVEIELTSVDYAPSAAPLELSSFSGDAVRFYERTSRMVE